MSGIKTLHAISFTFSTYRRHPTNASGPPAPMNAQLHRGPSLVRIVLVVAALAASAAAQSLTITSPATATGAVGSLFSYQITTSSPSTAYGAAPLPPGLSFNAGTGLISGTPVTAGLFTIGISATSGSGTGTSTVTVTITGVP